MKERTMATTAAEATPTTCSTVLHPSWTVPVEPSKRRSDSYLMDKAIAASLSKGAARPVSYPVCAARAEHHSTHLRADGVCRGGSCSARWTHRRRRTQRLTKRATVWVLYLLLPLLLYNSTPPASPRLTPVRAATPAVITTFYAPFISVRAVQYNLTLAFQTSDYVDNNCVVGWMTTPSSPTPLQTRSADARGSLAKEGAMAPTASTASVAIINVSACPYYPMWSLLAAEPPSFEETSKVFRGKVDTDAASHARVGGGKENLTSPRERRDRAAATVTVPSAERATYAVPDDLANVLWGPRNALAYYYEVLNTDAFFFMLQGCTIRISIDTDVPPAYPYNAFQRYADTYTLSVSATGGDGALNGHSGVRGSLSSSSSASTRNNGTEGDGDGDEVGPDVTLPTVFFFWNQPRLHCTYNAPALMSMMVDLSNQQQQQEDPMQSPPGNRRPRLRAREKSRPTFRKDDAVLAEASTQLTDGEAAEDPLTASSTGPVYPSCAANMPSPKNILPSSDLDELLTMNYMQLSSTVVVKVFSFDVWYQFTGTPLPATLAKGRIMTTTAPASATYSAVFSSDPRARSGGGSAGVPTDASIAGQPFNLLADPEKVCAAPALYTISLNSLLARASSRGLGSVTDSLPPSVTVTHDYPAARVIAVVAQCSGVPLSFSVAVNFVNPGSYPGSGQHYATSIIYFFFLVCYALLLVVFLIMIVPCSKRRRQRRGSGAGGGVKSTSDGPGHATAANEKKQSRAESGQRSADKARSGDTRGRLSRSVVARTGSPDGHRQDDNGDEELQAMSDSKGQAKRRATAAALVDKGKAPLSPSLSLSSTSGTAAQTRTSTQRNTAGDPVNGAESKPLHGKTGKRGGHQLRGGALQQHHGQLVAEKHNGGNEADNSGPGSSPLHSMDSNTSRMSSSGSDDAQDINFGSSEAQREAEARGGASRRGHVQSSRRSRHVTPSSSTLSSSTLSSSTLSSSTSNNSDCTSNTSDSTSEDDDCCAARRRCRRRKQRSVGREKEKQQRERTRQCRHGLSYSSMDASDAEWNTPAGDAYDDGLRRGAQRRHRGRRREREPRARRREGDEHRQCISSARSKAQGAASAAVSPRRWCARAAQMADVVRRHVMEPLWVWWAESHMLVMYAPIQWLVLVLIVLKCLLSALSAVKFVILAGVELGVPSLSHRLPLVCTILGVATDSLLIPTEMLVAMGWGLAFTTPPPTSHVALVCIATIALFITAVLSATCERDGLSMALTVNKHARLINDNQCNAIAYTRAAFELACRIYNVLRMFFLSLWLSKTVVPADAAAMQRQRKLREKQLQREQRKGRQGRGMAETGDSIGGEASGRSSLHHRPSSTSSGRRSGPSNVATTGTTTLLSTPITLRPPPRLDYPGVSLSAMEVYLRYRGMRVPFLMLLVWTILLLVFAFTFYEPEDYYMLIAFRELQTVYLLGFILLFFRTSAPFYC
ncbi:hypothetical protein MNV84_00338 [Leishmania braziliensis]|nr:hypothetical protein MNV84_00338 [Leishmania braziliensis]